MQFTPTQPLKYLEFLYLTEQAIAVIDQDVVQRYDRTCLVWVYANSPDACPIPGDCRVYHQRDLPHEQIDYTPDDPV